MPRSCLLTVFVCLLFALPVAVSADTAIDALIEEAGLREHNLAIRERDGWRPPAKIVVRGGEAMVAELDAAYPDVDIVSAGSEAEARAAAADADALIGFCGADTVAAASRLVWVQIYSAGAERCLAVERVGSGAVLLTNMQKIASPAIGEHAVAMAMALARGLISYGKRMPDGNWNPNAPGRSSMMALSGKTLLVVGLGGIGTEVARRGAGLGMRVVATRNSSREGPEFVDYVGLSDELLELARQADVVVNALPLTPATTGLFDKTFFDAVKPGALFVNVARGKSVVTADLVAALEDGRLGGAGLDVTEPEPLPPGHPLWQIPNVIITPHIAWAGADRGRRNTLVRENIRRYIAGEPLINVVDPTLGY